MSDYTAPVRDMRFVLNHVVDLKALSELPGYDHAEPDLVDAILEEGAKFAGGVLAPINWAGDQEGAKLENGVVRTAPGFADAYRRFSQGGWNGVPFDPELGGGGLPWAVTIPLTEMWNAANLAFSLCPLLTQGAIDALEAHGSDELKAKYLEKMVSGEWTATMNLTEPQAGSDVGALRTKAEPRGDGAWLIQGQKIFITFGEHDMTDNIVHLVLARTPGAPEGTKGISLFLVPKFFVNDDGTPGERNDVRCASLEEKIGIHGSPTCVMSYGDNGQCVGWMVGEEMKGMRAMFTMMNNARLSVGVQGVAIADRAYQRAVRFARDRVQGRSLRPGGTGAIIDHADVRRMLMTMKGYSEAARAICIYNAECLDFARRHPDESVRRIRQGMAELLTPISKGFGTDIGVEMASVGVQVHGGMGFVEETGAGQHYRDSRILPIYEGTNGIQAMDLVGRKLTLNGGEPMRALLADIVATADIAQGAADPSVQAMAGPLAEAADAAREAGEKLAAMLGSDMNGAGAGAAPFLRLMGLTVGGWLMTKAAIAAADLVEQGADDQPFLKAKIATAHFFATQIMVQAPALARAATAGAEPLYAIDDDVLVA
ncbi:MAG: acyl-CoA dehydrogenase [Rhizobiales bacterium NRL2]|jgi:alkylation response protein AidB-like acyl-CoA dehydrogenase|nr:MAG: acyl-CoA dehydrogenase [Rhizobiales bacterium NRL2]